MSFYHIPKKAYAEDRPTGKRPNPTRYMTKIRLPTQSKTKKCSICGMSGSTITVSNQKFIRCQRHIREFNMKSEIHEVVFERASAYL